MVYLHFPSNLTEEELMLQAKYQKLKKKKKALLKQKTPRTEPERSPVKISRGPKIEARDAREVAKKLLKSGAISPIVKAPKRSENEGFKRPSRFRAIDRKPTDETAVSNYQPFSSSAEEFVDSSKLPTYNPKIKNLYDNFVSGKKLNKFDDDEKADSLKSDKPKQGNTIFVSLYKINQDLLQKAFSPYGAIVDISLESEKNRGFVTFKKSESADKAIKEMDGQLVSNNVIKVTMARRQVVNPSMDQISSGDWRHIATTFNNKGGNYSDKREVVSYDDGFLDAI